MKNVLYIVLSFLLLTGCTGEQEVTFLQDRDGVKYEPNTEVGFTGVYVEKYDNGQKKLEEHYKNGKLVGISKSWLENGQKVVSSLEDRDGVMYEPNTEVPFSGGLVEKYDNGQKNVENHYKDGKKDGLEIWWTKDGQKSSEKHHKNGLGVGEWKEWLENGEERTTIVFDENGDGHFTTWYGDGQKLGEGNYKNGKRERLWTTWYDGNVLDTVTYKDGVEVQ
jgi:antitoxin component YwqK of YwqJK toxin-antitoxin module